MTEQQIPTSEVLNRAADEIERRGWTQGADGWDFFNTGASVCLEGAIFNVHAKDDPQARHYWSSRDVNLCPAGKAIHEYLSRDAVEVPLYRWNDNPRRTATEVVEVLRAVAVIEAAREQQPAGVSS